MLLHVGFKPTTVGAIESHLAHRAVVDVFNFAVKSPDCNHSNRTGTRVDYRSVFKAVLR